MLKQQSEADKSPYSLDWLDLTDDLENGVVGGYTDVILWIQGATEAASGSAEARSNALALEVNELREATG